MRSCSTSFRCWLLANSKIDTTKTVVTSHTFRILQARRPCTQQRQHMYIAPLDLTKQLPVFWAEAKAECGPSKSTLLTTDTVVRLLPFFRLLQVETKAKSNQQHGGQLSPRTASHHSKLGEHNGPIEHFLGRRWSRSRRFQCSEHFWTSLTQ